MPRVLLVDDDPGVLDTCGAFLRLAGMDVETAACGRGAVNALARESFDLLLLDIQLPDFSGLDVLRVARQRGLNVPAVFITGHPGFDSSVEALRLGAADYLRKPVDGDALVAAALHVCGWPQSPDPAIQAGDTARVDDPVTEQVVRDRAIVSDGAAVVADGLDLWADAMWRVVTAPHDVPTVGRWAVLLKIAPETLRRWCRRARLDARASLDLARVLRAVRCAHLHGGPLDRFLAPNDPHTLARMLALAGIQSGSAPAVGQVLTTQTLIQDGVAVAMLRARLAGPGSGFHQVATG